MKTLRSLLLLSPMSVCALLTAKADSLSITLQPALQTGAPGDDLAFDATVTNVSGSTVFLNGDSFYVDAPLTVDDSPFDSYPYSLAAGGSYSGAMFNIDIPNGTPAGLYAGYFDILGGGDSSASSVVGEADFNVQVTPEPSSVLLLVTGLAGLGLLLLLRRACQAGTRQLGMKS